MSLLVAGSCDIGRIRSINQDHIYLNQEKNLFIIADGMGGHDAGDLASKMAVECFTKHFLAQEIGDTPEEQIRQSLLYANQRIKDCGNEHKALKGMGTTFLGLFFSGPDLYLVNVGDSRAYLINNEMIFQLSRDHSLIQEKVNLGIYTREQAVKDPQKNVLVQAVGFELDVKIDIFKYKVHYKDTFLLCSDGLYGMVKEADMLSIVNKNLSPDSCSKGQMEGCVKELMQSALVNGGIDNISCILIKAQ